MNKTGSDYNKHTFWLAGFLARFFKQLAKRNFSLAKTDFPADLIGKNFKNRALYNHSKAKRP